MIVTMGGKGKKVCQAVLVVQTVVSVFSVLAVQEVLSVMLVF